MVKVIQDENNTVVEPWWGKEKAIYIGAGLGLVWWVLTAILRRYVVEPLACRDLTTASTCVESLGVSGNVATVIVAVIGTALLVRYLQGRPIVVAIASAIVLWGLAGYMEGLTWYVTLFWSVIFYMLTYLLFSTITKIRHLGLALGVSFVIAIGIQILLAL